MGFILQTFKRGFYISLCNLTNLNKSNKISKSLIL